MIPRLESLRGRFVASLILVFSFGLGGGVVLRASEEHPDAGARLGGLLLRGPHRELSALVPFGLTAFALIWVVSGWSMRHLASASREAALVGASDPGARISRGRLPGEVRPLVDAVNGTLDRLADARAAERRFVADAAHALRTPLAVLGLRLQGAESDGDVDWRVIERDVGRVNRLAAQLLDLARMEHARQADPWPAGRVANLSRAAREAAAAVVPIAEEAGRAVEVELPEVLSVGGGRPDDLRDMVRNLLDNALAHGRGTIRIGGGVEAGREGRREAWISVGDEGPGVTAELWDVAFDRFRKGDAASPGHGLGLAIVREVARGHGGSVAFLPGPGCRVWVALPLAG